MDRDQLLNLIKDKLDSGLISRQDLADVSGGNLPQSQSVVTSTKEKEPTDHNSKIVHVLYAIGVIIIVIGVIVLIAQSWDEIGLIGRVGVTLGLAFIAYVVGLLRSKEENNTLSQVMFLLASVLAPGGVFILLDGLGISINAISNIGTSLILLIVFGLAQYIVRNRILVITLIAYATWLYFALIVEYISDITIFNISTVIKLLVIVLGIAYYLFAYWYTKREDTLTAVSSKRDRHQAKAITHILYALGALAIIVPFMTFEGVWDFFAILIICAITYLGYAISSKITFAIGVITFTIQLIAISWRYFADSLGWPISMILSGIVVIAIGYGALRVSRGISNKI